MKVLFLDIDGVLNSRRSCAAFDGYPHSFSKEDMGRLLQDNVLTVAGLLTNLEDWEFTLILTLANGAH